MSDKMSMAEAGYLGYLASKDTIANNKELRRLNYLNSPTLCLFCKKILSYEKKKYKFCNHSCSASFNNTKILKKCVSCGCEIVYSKHYDKRKYCSKKCQSVFRTKISYSKIEQGKVKEPRALRNYLIINRGYKCEVCINVEWMGKPIPLELDHKDGNSENNIPENIRLICCNCHAQTPNYKSKNLGNGRFKRRQRYVEGKSY